MDGEAGGRQSSSEEMRKSDNKGDESGAAQIQSGDD